MPMLTELGAICLATGTAVSACSGLSQPHRNWLEMLGGGLFVGGVALLGAALSIV
jgi:hypothetical protein